MRFFRTHIIRFAGISLLLGRIVFYFLNPVDEIKHDAFANWLQSNLKTQDDSAVLDEINELSYLDEELETVIRKASVLVQNHYKDFELPLSEHPEDENEIFKLLLTEFNAFQDFAAGMGKATGIKNIKPTSVLPTGTLAFLGNYLSCQQAPILTAETVFNPQHFNSQDFHISPLSGGTAIGAP